MLALYIFSIPLFFTYLYKYFWREFLRDIIYIVESLFHPSLIISDLFRPCTLNITTGIFGLRSTIPLFLFCPLFFSSSLLLFLLYFRLFEHVSISCCDVDSISLNILFGSMDYKIHSFKHVFLSVTASWCPLFCGSLYTPFLAPLVCHVWHLLVPRIPSGNSCFQPSNTF